MNFLKQTKVASVATLALLFSFYSAGNAHAVEVYKSKAINLEIFGNLALGVGVGKHEAYMAGDDDLRPSSAQLRADSIMGVDAYTIAPNGYKIGARAEIELYNSEIETFQIYLSGPFGEFMLGQADNASNYLHLTHPQYLAPGLATVDWADFNFFPRNSVNESDNNLQSGGSTFFTYDDVALQLVYLSPAIQGFNFAISWTPNPCANVGSPDVFKGRSSNDECGKIPAFSTASKTALATAKTALETAQAALAALGTAPTNDEVVGANDEVAKANAAVAEAQTEDYIITNVITLATRFARQESFGLNWAVSGAYLFGERGAPSNTPYAYSLGLNASYADFHIGGAWQNSRNLNEPSLEDKVWTAGVAYYKDNWRIGSAYRQSRRVIGDDNATENSVAFNREMEVGLSYELAKNFWTSLSFEYIWDRKRPDTNNSTKRSVGGALYLSYSF